MEIGAINAITYSSVSSQAKDPPWGAEDLSKLRMLMGEGLSESEIARQLGTTIGDVAQKVAALTASTSNTAGVGSAAGTGSTSGAAAASATASSGAAASSSAASSAGTAAANPLVGNNVDITV